MKAIMKTIKPKICANIMNLIQSILVIKDKKTATATQKLIDEYGFVEFYVYCTKDRNDLVKFSMGGVGYKTPNFKQDYPKNVKWIGNGKVPFKFRCYKIDNYLKGKLGYAIHINDLEILDKPKELSEFYKVGYLEERYAVESHLADIEGCDGGVNESYVDKLYEELDQEFQLKKAPQSWCYVEVENDEKEDPGIK